MRANCLLLATVSLISACDSPQTWRVYRVEAETLSHVAAKTGFGVSALKSFNSMRDDTVAEGRGLLVMESPKTRHLPVWRQPVSAPEWKECTALEFVPLVSGCSGDVCISADAELTLLEISIGQHVWRTTHPQFGSLEDAFLHTKVDLDGDGVAESVISIREGSSNGIALEWWTHLVISRGQPIASFASQDFGRSFVKMEKGCALMPVVTDWRTDQLRGDGLYFSTQLHVLDGMALRAVGPEVVRRFTHRFEDHRWKVLEHALTERHPLEWFRDEGAFVWTDAEDEAQTCRPTRVLREGDDSFELENEGTWKTRVFEADHSYDVLIDTKTGARLLKEYRPFNRPRWDGAPVQVCSSAREGRSWVELRVE